MTLKPDDDGVINAISLDYTPSDAQRLYDALHEHVFTGGPVDAFLEDVLEQLEILAEHGII